MPLPQRKSVYRHLYIQVFGSGTNYLEVCAVVILIISIRHLGEYLFKSIILSYIPPSVVILLLLFIVARWRILKIRSYVKTNPQTLLPNPSFNSDPAATGR